MLKRIRRELETWPHEGHAPSFDASASVLSCDGVEIGVPPSYPFDPPKIRNIQYLTERPHPETWCLALLSSPFLCDRYATWDIPCTCCHALTCPAKWTPRCRLHQVWEDAHFHALYARLRHVTLPCTLPPEVLEHIVLLSRRDTAK